MLFLRLKDSDLEPLFKLAAEKKGASVERLARLAFLKGLRSLVKKDEVSLGGETRLWLHAPSSEVLKYIKQHWEQESDQEIAKQFPEYKWFHIRAFRLKLGLKRPRGRLRSAEDELNITPPPLTKHKQRRQQLEALICEHWKEKDDAEIGRLMQPPMSRGVVYTRRLALGLHRSRNNGKCEGVLREAIVPEEFERLVLHEGYTMPEYIQLKELSCTRERLRQVAQELGLKHSLEDRAPEWVLVRKARQLGNLNLANREWLAEKVAAATSMVALAAELGLNEYDLFFFIRAFKFTHPSFRKHGAETVDLVCAKCGTKFTRLKRWVDMRRKRANGHQQELEFYCSVLCASKYDRAAARQRREMSPEALRLKQLKQEKLEREAAFIREHWQTMTDAQMGETLGLAKKTIADKRVALGLRRA